MLFIIKFEWDVITFQDKDYKKHIGSTYNALEMDIGL